MLFICALLVCTGTIASAQTGTLTGKLLDQKSAPLPYANVSVIRVSDQSLISGTLTGVDGKFSAKSPAPGKYLLRFTSIGFSELKTEVFEVNTTEFSRDFGSFSLKPEVKNLADVSVTTLRPTIVQLADRMVVSVEGTAMAAGNSAYAVLSRAPGVFIDAEGNIQLNGRSGVTVMLDGKLTYLSARDLRNMLEAMPAENLKNIEIITNPSAKYDAEGTSGILNINLKKNTQQGMNGSVYATYNYNFKKQHGFSSGLNINHKSGKWNSFVNIDLARRVGGRDATFTRVFYGTNKTTYFDQDAIGSYTNWGPPSVRVGTDYSFNERHTVGVMVNYTKNTGDQEFLTDTRLGSEAGKPTQIVEADNYSTNTYRNLTTNLHYTGKLDTNGALLTSDLDYVRITNRGTSDFYNYYASTGNGPKTQDFLFTNTPNGYDIYSGKIDLTLPIRKVHKLETGAKASRVISDNDFQFYFNNGALVLDPLRTNHFKYRENIYAGYLNYSGPINKKLTLQTGLRLEHTASLGNSITLGVVTPRNYTNLFPSVFLQQKVNDNYGINYSYSRRLTRPNYGNLNPFRAYRDPYTWYEGNTQLRPQYTNSFSVTQVFKKAYNLSFNYYHYIDVISEVPLLDVEDTTTVYTFGNINKGHSVGLTAVAPVKILKKWDTQNTLVASYNKYAMQTNFGEVINDQLFVMLQSNHIILLPKEIRMEVNIMLRGPAASGLYHMAAMSRVDLAFKRSFLNKKLDLTINGLDLFEGFRYLWTTDIGGQVNEFDQYFRIRAVGVSLRYNFSRGQKVEQKRRSSGAEEVNRT
ncbi:TonB-dependent receptor [Segetibacter sp. 3557_3]|nr:TonB-dependent receptor [Segetibacter sp. 3557_3]